MNGSRSVVAGIALTLSLVAIALGLLVILAPAAPTPPPPATIDSSLLITGEGSIGGPALSHLYHPQLLVARRGDTVRLRVINQSFYRHAIEVVGYDVRTGPLTGGEQSSEVLTFVADKPGIFVYRCYLPYEPATATCAPDHDRMVGHLIVIESGAR
jgi:plastocyanin